MRIRLLVEDIGCSRGTQAITFKKDGVECPFPCKIQVCYGTEIGDTTYYNEWEDIDVVFRSGINYEQS